MRTYIAFLASLTLVSVFIVNFLPIHEGESSILRSPSIPYTPLLPTAVCAPCEAIAEPAPVFSQNVPSGIIDIPSEIYEPEPFVVALDVAEQPVAQQFSPPAVVGAVEASQTVLPQTVSPPTPAASAEPSYVYFYTGVPVQPAPAAVFVYASGTVHTVPMSMVPPASPPPVSGQVRTVRTHVVPVFTPQVAPSRFGAPRLVYSNGVVIKPTVYFPNQPMRNTIRGFTP